jgi:hypothetical protein
MEHEDSCTVVVYKPEFTPRTSRTATAVQFPVQISPCLRSECLCAVNAFMSSN